MCTGEGNGIIAGLIVAAAMLFWAFADGDGRHTQFHAAPTTFVVALSADPSALEIRAADSSFRVRF